MICQKCNNSEFDEFECFGAKLKTCKKCKQTYHVGGSREGLDQYQKERKQALANRNKKPSITCPYCKSTNTKKISGGSRWLSTGLFGLASSKVGKQWHCNSCKSDF